MKNVSLLGKKYQDFLFFFDKLTIGETNHCDNYVERLGGIYNLLDVKLEKINFIIHTFGLKKALIINNKENSNRTTITVDVEPSIIREEKISQIENNSDWCHVAYLDDIEDYEKIKLFNIPISIDFCTNSNREKYLDIINQCKVAFDSRERKHLYLNIDSLSLIHI